MMCAVSDAKSDNGRSSGGRNQDGVLANLPRQVSVGFAARLDDVDDGASFRRLAPSRGF